MKKMPLERKRLPSFFRMRFKFSLRALPAPSPDQASDRPVQRTGDVVTPGQRLAPSTSFNSPPGSVGRL